MDESLSMTELIPTILDHFEPSFRSIRHETEHRPDAFWREFWLEQYELRAGDNKSDVYLVELLFHQAHTDRKQFSMPYFDT